MRPLFQPNEGTLSLYQMPKRLLSTGLKLDHGQFGGGSDGNFTGALGVPTLDGFGGAWPRIATKDEHLFVSSLVPRTGFLPESLRLCRSSPIVKIEELADPSGPRGRW
ncbi:MAG: hypothetical protein Ct9H300mP16_05440 [Pseudomonadota bacterium]|nr:MAG: hypothetical protein Ct9H300mP16_05440 [Pseudomonadota bacterium]